MFKQMKKSTYQLLSRQISAPIILALSTHRALISLQTTARHRRATGQSDNRTKPLLRTWHLARSVVKKTQLATHLPSAKSDAHNTWSFSGDQPVEVTSIPLLPDLLNDHRSAKIRPFPGIHLHLPQGITPCCAFLTPFCRSLHSWSGIHHSSLCSSSLLLLTRPAPFLSLETSKCVCKPEQATGVKMAVTSWGRAFPELF